MSVEDNPNIPIELNAAQAETDVAQKSLLGRAYNLGKTAIETVIIAVDVGPLNEILTYGSALATLHATKNPALAAAVAGGTTGALEGVSGVATADLLTSNKDSKPIKLLNKGLHSKSLRKYILNEEGRLNPVAEDLLALYGGAAIVMTAKEADILSEERTFGNRAEYGVKVAGILGAICTAEAYLVAEGIVDYKDPRVVAPVIAGLVGLFTIMNKVKKKVTRKTEVIETLPNYELNPEQYAGFEDELVSLVEKKTAKGLLRKKQEGVYAVWMPSDHKFANLARTKEAEYFPEVKEIDEDYEDETVFLALVDTRKGSKRVVHASTVSGINGSREHLETDKTGLTTIDELIEEGNFTADEFRAYYSDRDIDLDGSFSVDTNFWVGEKAEKFDGLKTSELAYLSLFQLIKSKHVDNKINAIFASVNMESIESFKRLDLQVEPLMGRTDLTTPESKDGKEFVPVVIPYNKHNVGLFENIGYTIPELSLI